jgi:hypothetical protein
VRACVRELQRGVGKGRTLLLGEDDFDHTPKELAAVPVLLGVLRILVVEELDEGERLLPPADAHSVSGACLGSQPARGAYSRPHPSLTSQISSFALGALGRHVMVVSCLHACEQGWHERGISWRCA